MYMGDQKNTNIKSVFFKVLLFVVVNEKLPEWLQLHIFYKSLESYWSDKYYSSKSSFSSEIFSVVVLMAVTESVV